MCQQRWYGDQVAGSSQSYLETRVLGVCIYKSPVVTRVFEKRLIT